MYEERVSGSELPESTELRRTAFRPDPEGTPRMHERLCERSRVAATAMWYVVGTMGQADGQEELKAALYDLYEKHGKSVDGLKDELGDRDQAASQGFDISGWQRAAPGRAKWRRQI